MSSGTVFVFSIALVVRHCAFKKRLQRAVRLWRPTGPTEFFHYAVEGRTYVSEV
jgi:hypothetical protein